MAKLWPYKVAIGIGTVLSLLFLYAGIATGELTGGQCGGKFSIFHRDPMCRAPVYYAICFYVCAIVTVMLLLARRFRR
jgi:hypothetical protein